MGRPRKYKARTLWGAIQCIAATGCHWALLPRGLPSFTAVQYHFYRMRDNGLLNGVNVVLLPWVRVTEGREPATTAAIINSQSVKITEAGGLRGCDASKKIKGRKRHIATDRLGNMLKGVVHGGDVQDRDGATDLIEQSCDAYPALNKLFADGGYAGQKLEAGGAHIDRLTIPDFEDQQGMLAHMSRERRRHGVAHPVSLTGLGHDKARAAWRGQSGRLRGVPIVQNGNDMFVGADDCISSRPPAEIVAAQIDQVGCFPTEPPVVDHVRAVDDESWSGCAQLATVAVHLLFLLVFVPANCAAAIPKATQSQS